MEPVDEETYECVVLDGHRAKVTSNSDDPPNSYHSHDLFKKHPSIPHAWKYVGRMDHRITLSNGEKVLPLPIEGRISQNPLVNDAVVLGVERTIPGLLIFPADDKEDASDAELIERLWPTVDDANKQAEAFSQISKGMIAVVPRSLECPLTDKSSIKRAQVYQDFASQIEETYQNFDGGESGTLKLNVQELESYLIDAFKKRLGVTLSNVDSNFFGSGVDSMKAVQMRSLIRRSLDLGGRGSNLGPTIVLDHGNPARLARYLHSLRTGETYQQEDEIQLMSNLVKKYSNFGKHVPVPAKSYDGEYIVSDISGFSLARPYELIVNLGTNGSYGFYGSPTSGAASAE